MVKCKDRIFCSGLDGDAYVVEEQIIAEQGIELYSRYAHLVKSAPRRLTIEIFADEPESLLSSEQPTAIRPLSV